MECRSDQSEGRSVGRENLNIGPMRFIGKRRHEGLRRVARLGDPRVLLPGMRGVLTHC